jgi:DNA modification methylase
LAGTMVEAGWVLRNRIVWVKDRPVPSNAVDRLDSQYEFVYLLVKRDGRRPNYRFTKPLSDRGDVWTIPVRKSSQVHYATFPVELAERCLSHVARPGMRVLDPFSGSGTTGVATLDAGGQYVGVEINPTFAAESRARLHAHGATLFATTEDTA